MIPELMLYLSTFLALVTAIVAGVFLTFSDFVMRALRASPPDTGIQSMQAINRTVYRSVFLVLLLGMAPVSLAILFFTVSLPMTAGSYWLLWGSVIYLLGVIAVTMICNVPMNKRLDAMVPEARETRLYWVKYARNWTLWNHLRTLASAAAAYCFLMGALLLVAR